MLSCNIIEYLLNLLTVLSPAGVVIAGDVGVVDPETVLVIPGAKVTVEADVADFVVVFVVVVVGVVVAEVVVDVVEGAGVVGLQVPQQRIPVCAQ